jgi:lipopolysaccharide/colanic/teichoic acid biosynthesis glycosyltransferase
LKRFQFLKNLSPRALFRLILVKRVFDFIVSALGIVVFSPLLILSALLVKVDSPGPIFFKQQRIGKEFRPFWIYKFRTMRASLEQGPNITIGNDPRITGIGRLLRQSKIDELPQLINILRGEMSFVGPRPEVPQYVQLYRKEYQQILTVRPGLTDLASLKYRDEAALLAGAENPEEEYVTRILPDKIMLATDYIQRASFFFDLRLILETILRLVLGRVFQHTSRT